jgi:hypothetical protein
VAQISSVEEGNALHFEFKHDYLATLCALFIIMECLYASNAAALELMLPCSVDDSAAQPTHIPHLVMIEMIVANQYKVGTSNRWRQSD